MRHFRTAFTLIELLAVIAIIGLLAALLIPAVGAAADRGKTIKCLSNLRQVGTIGVLFAGDYEGKLPGQEGTNPTYGWGTENPNGKGLLEELVIYEQKRTSGLTKPDYYVCPTTVKQCAQYAGDLRFVSYKPGFAPWLRTTLYRFGFRHANYPALINGIPPANYMITPSAIPTVNNQGPAKVIFLTEQEIASEGRIRCNSPVQTKTDPEGNRIMDFNVRLSHNNKQGLNLLYFDLHAENDASYTNNFSTETASLKESGTAFYLDAP